MSERPHDTRMSTAKAGARFYKCALQVNPHGYAEEYRGRPSGFDEAGYAQALVAKAETLDINVLAVTDHNSVSGVDAVRAVARQRNIVVFPGFELTSKESIHILCLYEPETSTTQLERFLGQFGLLDTARSSSPCGESFSDVLAIVADQGGVTVAAHVTHDKGLLRMLQGQSRINAWRDQNLLAIQIPSTVDALSREDKEIIQNRNPHYIRSPAPETALALAVINAKDVAQPDDLADPGVSCFVKMSEVRIEGLRQAFLDPGSRIRLNSDPTPEEHSELISLAWQGGFLANETVNFNSNLNVLVGGRGAGKSTVIESLRYVLDLEPLGEDALAGHIGILKHVLRSGTKISLLVRCHRPTPREYRIERTIPNPPVVRECDTDQVLDVKPADVFPDVEVYGQHEISELAKSREKLTRLLERFRVKDDTITHRKRELLRELELSRQRIVEAEKELSDIKERLTALPGLEETLRRYEDAGLEDNLKDQSLLVREERLLDTIPERVLPLRTALESLRQDLPIDRTFLSSKAVEGLPGKDILAEAERVLRQLSADAQRATDMLAASLAKADLGFQDIKERFAVHRAAVQLGYEQKLRELQKEQVDGEEFIQLRRRVEKLRPLKERQAAQERAEREYRNRRRSLLVEWEEAKAEEFRALERAAKRVGQKLQGRVRVRVAFAGNREELKRILRDEIGGRLSEALNALEREDALSPAAFVDACRKGVRSLSEFGITGQQAEKLARASNETLMKIEELDLPATTAIELNTTPLGEGESWHTLEQLSTGQKATAVLLLLLLESEAPLVVDQPEDDLDNRFITEGIVPRIREEKRRRQFLLSTHNANIPVLGDAELIVGLSPSGEAQGGGAKIAADEVGAIDAEPVRKLVEELLEGGKDAFERRRRKYGF